LHRFVLAGTTLATSCWQMNSVKTISANHGEPATLEASHLADTVYGNAPSISGANDAHRGQDGVRWRKNGVKLALSKRTVQSSTYEACCHVCGADVREKWFVHFAAARETFYLCSAACALTFFDAAKPPAHDHKARHEYHRVRTRIVRAARIAQAATGGGAGPSVDAQAAQDTL
jgi:hypothetical protein